MFKTTATCPRNYDFTAKDNPCDCNCKNEEGLTPNVCAADCEKYKAKVRVGLRPCAGGDETKRYNGFYDCIPIRTLF